MLTPGQTISLADGSQITVGQRIGAGGQGEVFRAADSCGAAVALKIFTADAISGDGPFRRALERNIAAGAPSAAFLWPTAITHPDWDGLGYVMPLCPEGLLDLGDFFCIDRHPGAWFRSQTARLRAAAAICRAFDLIHSQGYSFHDIHEGNFMVHPATGDIAICDTDAILPDDTAIPVAGKSRYMAPEVMEGKKTSRASDLLSLAIVLYRLFVLDHPYEGAQTAAFRGPLTPGCERELYGLGAVFCHDPLNAANRPVAGLHDNSIRFWPQLPESLQNAFVRALGPRALADPTARMAAREWHALFASLLADTLLCPGNGADIPAHDYIWPGDGAPSQCPLCGRPTAPMTVLRIAGAPAQKLPAGKELRDTDHLSPLALATYTTIPRLGAVPALRNLSVRPWKVKQGIQKPYALAPGDTLGITDGTEIDFGTFRAVATVMKPAMR